MVTIPIIANTDRIIDATPGVSTSAFTITWPVIADTEALAEDDFVVIVNGVQKTTAEFTFAGVAIAGVSGIWNGGTLTLGTAVSGVRVIIYSKKDPRRTSGFLEGRPLPMTTLDAALDDITLMMRDLHLGLKRALKFPAGDIADNISPEIVEYGAARAGFYLGFGATGEPALLSGTGADGALRADLASASLSVGDALIAVKRNATGSTARTLHNWIEDRAYSVKDFGAVGNGSTDDTAAIAAAVAVVNANGGGHLIFPPGGNYKVLGVNGAALFEFANCNGITIECQDDAIITDGTTWSGSQQGDLFEFTACNNITLKLRTSSQVAVTTTTNATRGLWVASFFEGCKGIKLDLDITGGIGGIRCERAFNASVAHRCRHISGKVRASGTFYPVNNKFSGDDLDIQIDADTCARPFFIYGVSSQRIRLTEKNTQVTSLIKAYSGYGCSEVDVTIVDIASDTHQGAAAPRLGLHWGDSTPATHRNINIRMCLINPAGSAYGNAIEFHKYSDDINADLTGRGHVLDGIEISGYSDVTGTGKNHFATGAGSFNSPDIVRRVTLGPMTLVGGGAFSLDCSVLEDVATVQGVTSDAGFYTGNIGTGRVVHIASKAANFTSNATTSTDVHDYVHCHITSGNLQNYADNKTFTKTKLPSGAIKDGLRSEKAEKYISGSLAGPTNLVKIPALATGFSGRLTYYVTYDNSDFVAGSRRESRGVKYFTGTITSAGVMVAQIAQGDEVTQRTSFGTPPVITVSFVNGDATGGFVAVACTEYTTSASRGHFKVEIESFSELLTVTPV